MTTNPNIEFTRDEALDKFKLKAELLEFVRAMEQNDEDKAIQSMLAVVRGLKQ